MTTSPTSLDALTRLNAALGDLAHALLAGDAPAVLAAEAPIAAALELVAGAQPTPAADRARLAEEVQRARLTLARCRALGASITELSEALAPRATYGPASMGRPS
jgi:hypothetical protein